MAEDEEVIAGLVNGITYVTGSPKFSGQIGKALSRWKTKLWLMSLIIWTSIIFFLIWRR
jgi:hypothetical protein